MKINGISMTQAISRQKQNYRSVLDLADRLKLNREQIRAIIGISESTQFRYEKNNPVLKPNLWDRWVRFVKIVETAEDLFESDLEIQRWLFTPKQTLNGNCPIELLSTDVGTKEVEQILLQASYGVFA
ncbi:MAG: antitoxin Xre/MbcA/ParS toxin-binding domain-containing protein [Waterburya sp.]